MFSSSSFDLKTEQAKYSVYQLFSRQDEANYMAAMAHTEVFQQQSIINKLIRGQLRWGRGARVRRILIRPRLHPERRGNLAYMISSRLISEKGHITFKNPIQMKCIITYSRRPVSVSGNNIPETRSHWIHASTQLPLHATWILVPSIQTCSTPDESLRTLPVVVRELCNAMCEDYYDEAITAPPHLKNRNK